MRQLTQITERKTTLGSKLLPKLLVILLTQLLSIKSAVAVSIDWGGAYRMEFVEIDRTSLSTPPLKKSYILNHLNLTPKIMAADGVTVIANIEVLPNLAYPDSQLGQSFGGGTSSTSTTSSVVNGNQQPGTLQVNQLYLKINQEYGALIAGRAPMHFGLGITHNAAAGAFDHWYRVRDVIGYKILIGNLSIMPILSKMSDSSMAVGGDVTAQTWDVMYNNAETESAIGVMHETRAAGMGVNDAHRYFGGTVTGGWGSSLTNLYFARGFQHFKFKMEAGFHSGNTGLTTSTNEEIKINGYGIALDMGFPGLSESWEYNLKTGIASGDNSSTVTYEGFTFNRNYDIAFMLFNHPLGASGLDLFTTRAQRNIDTSATCSSFPCPVYNSDVAADEETISNAVYFAPQFNYTFNERWQWTNTLTVAQLQNAPANFDKYVGTEWDTGFVFKPHPKIYWKNELGLLFPGGAFKGSSVTNNFGNSFTFGLQSRVSIGF
jgi:hypothetical protein